MTDAVDLVYNIPVHLFFDTTTLRQNYRKYTLKALGEDIEDEFYDAIDPVGRSINDVELRLLQITVYDSNNENSKKELREFLSFRNSTIV